METLEDRPLTYAVPVTLLEIDTAGIAHGPLTEPLRLVWDGDQTYTSSYGFFDCCFFIQQEDQEEGPEGGPEWIAEPHVTASTGVDTSTFKGTSHMWDQRQAKLRAIWLARTTEAERSLIETEVSLFCERYVPDSFIGLLPD